MKLLIENWREYLTENKIADVYRAFILNAHMLGKISPRDLLSSKNKNLKQHIEDYNHRKKDVSDEELYNYIRSLEDE